MTATALIVMEPGSDWPGQIGDSTILVGFCEAGDELVRKTQAKLDAFRDGKQSVRVAVLACNSTAGSVATGRRAQLARMLLGAVTETTHGRLILSSSKGASDELRRELLAVAGALTEDLQGTTATISLRFSPIRAQRTAPSRRPTMSEPMPCARGS
jgi:hypothetical protein